MPRLDPNRRFLERRGERRHIGLFVLPVALVGLVAGWGLLYTFWPLAVNPWTVFGRIEQHTFEEGTLGFYALLCTVLVNVIFALLCAFLLLAIAWARHERRYLKLLETQPSEASTPREKAEPVRQVSPEADRL